MQKTKSGFTIVELLIVVVVIAILAAITVVAYTGIQQRARNAVRIAAAKEWVNSIEAYIAANGTYPGAIATLYCIGESNITDFDENPDIDCGVSNNIKHTNAGTTTFNNNIKSLRSSLPEFPGNPVEITSALQGAGMLFRATDIYDPTGENVASYPTLIFFLEGSDQDCVLRPLATAYGGGSFVQATGKNSYSNIGTACRVMLTNPMDL